MEQQCTGIVQTGINTGALMYRAYVQTLGARRHESIVHSLLGTNSTFAFDLQVSLCVLHLLRQLRITHEYSPHMAMLARKRLICRNLVVGPGSLPFQTANI